MIDADGAGHAIVAYDAQGNEVYNSGTISGANGEQLSYTILDDALARIVVSLGDGLDTSAIDDVEFICPSIPAVPDLQISATPQLPQEGLAGAAFPLSFDVANEGLSETSTSWVDRVYLSLDTVLDAGDVSAGAVSQSAPLHPGDEYTVNGEFTYAVAAGNYYIIVKTDGDETVNEAFGEGNNIFVSPMTVSVQAAPKPDLQVTAVAVPTATACPTPGGLVSGSSVEVTYTVTNDAAAGPTSGGWQDSVFLTSGMSLAPDLSTETGLGTFLFSRPLQPGESYTKTVTVQLPEDLDGCHHVAVYADCRPVGSFQVGDAYNIDEANELNNVGFSAEYQIDLAAQPDLQILSGPSYPGLSATAEMLTVTYQVRNDGTGATDSGTWTDRIYLSRDTNLVVTTGGATPDILLAENTRSGSPLPGQTDEAVQMVSGLIPVDQSGIFYVKLSIDHDNDVTEAGNMGIGESNNFAVGPMVDVTQTSVPDLEATAVIGPGTPVTPGHQFFVMWTVGQTGPARVFSAWRDEIWLSENGVFGDGDDILLGSAAHTTSVDAMGDPELLPYSAQLFVILPSDTPNTPHQLFVRLNGDSGLFEGANTLTNIASTPLTIQLLPTDLTVATCATSPLPTDGDVGETLSVCWQVTNSGSGHTPVPEWVDRVYLSDDANLDPMTDTLLASVAQESGLLAGLSYDETASVVIPETTPGSYHLLFVVDADNSVYEQSPGEDMNVLAVPFTVNPDAADLIVQPTSLTLSPPDTLLAGSQLQVDWTIENAGTRETNATTWIDRVYLSTDLTHDTTDLLLGGRTHTGALQPGESYGVTASYIVPASEDGVRFVIVVTDITDSVFEMSESNNETPSAPLLVQDVEAPNLDVTNVTAPSTAVAGQGLTVSWTVTNSGDGPTLATSWYDSVYLSVDEIVDEGDVALGTLFHDHGSALGIGQSYNEMATFVIPLATAGDHFVLVQTDVLDDVEEDNEADNVGSDPELIDVETPDPADLTVANVTVPGQPAFMGTSFTANWLIENTAGVNVQTIIAEWNDAVFLSTDATWDPTDICLDVIPSGGPHTLAPGDSELITASFVAPTVTPGLYHLVTRTDSENQILETNEDNNLGASTGTFSIDARPLTIGAQATGDMESGGFAVYVVTSVPAGDALEFIFDHSNNNAWTELYVKHGAVPTPEDFDFEFQDPLASQQTIQVPDTLAGDYYLLARAFGGFLATNDDYTLEANDIDLTIASVEPSRIGDLGRVTLEILGARFDSTVDVELLPDVGPPIECRKIQRLDASRMLVEFELFGESHGAYDIRVFTTLATETAVDAITIEAVIPPSLGISIEEEQTFRAAETGSMTLQVINQGNIDAGFVALSHRIPAAPEREIVASITETPHQLAWSDGAILYDTALFRSVRPDQAVELTTVLTLQVTPGELPITQGAVILTHSEMLGLQDTIAGEIQDALLADPGILPPDDYVALLPEVADQFSVAWRDEWFQHLIDAGILDPEDLFMGGTPPFEITPVSCPETRPVDDTIAGFIAAYEASASATYFRSEPPDEHLVALERRIGALWQNSRCVPVDVLGALDPNEKVRPGGSGVSRFIGYQNPYTYTIFYENIADPTMGGTAASRVVVVDELPANLPVSRVRLGDITIADTLIPVPENRVFFQTRTDAFLESQGVRVDITAVLDANAHVARWIFQSIDPATGLPPTGGELGFLPPSNVDGVGNVAFTAFAQKTTPTGQEDVVNRATITFDSNPPIETNVTVNALDADDPESTTNVQLNPGGGGGGAQGGASGAGSDSATVTLTGSDPSTGSGLRDFTVYVQRESDTIQVLAQDTTETTHTFYGGEMGTTYHFYTVARDNAGNREEFPVVPDASIYFPGTAPTISQQPLSQEVCVGGSVELSVTAEGSPPLTYQWFVDGIEITGETASTLSLSNFQVADEGAYSVNVTNNDGTIISADAVLTARLLPSVVTHPQNTTVCPGDPLTLDVMATGPGMLTYQWKIDGMVIAGATSATHHIPSVSGGDSGSYTVDITNDCGTVTSNAAAVDVQTRPSIVTQPTGQVACIAESVTFDATYAGDQLQYSWIRESDGMQVGTASTLVLASVGVGDAGDYRVEVSNACGIAVSASAMLTVELPVVITAHPVGDTVCEGDPATLSVTATGTPPLTYTWKKDGSRVLGANSSDLTIAAVSLDDAGDYTVEVTNNCGQTMSMATSATATLVVQEPATIVTPVSDAAECPGSMVVLSVVAAGTPPPSYQWSKDGSPLSGETNATLTITDLDAADAGNYSVEVTNRCATVSSNASVTLLQPPLISLDVTDQDVCEGQTATLIVIANGSSPLDYQWRVNGVDIPGETSETLTLPNVTALDAAGYDVVVSNSCGDVTSSVGMLSVLTVADLACDCNGNGILDATDIMNGTLTDTQPDGIPDECQREFIRGDANVDGGTNIADAVATLAFLFSQGTSDCHSAMDSNDDGGVNIADPIYLLAHLFSSGPPPLPPHPLCGVDPTPDPLTCDSYTTCP